MTNDKWVEYKNGNYSVKLNLSNGTKIRETFDPDAKEFFPDFPESMDVKITNKCDMNCPFCSEGSTDDGKHGDILKFDLLDTIAPYTEVAIGGGNVLSHPDLFSFLLALKDRKVIANITVNQLHFVKHYDIIEKMIDEELVKGIGVSLYDSKDELFYELIKKTPNAIVHVINGIVTSEDIDNMINKNISLLILGYKNIRRGANFYSSSVEKNQKMLYEYIPNITNNFKIVCLDNLAIEQLNPQRFISKEQWDELYMGEDGQFTFFVDLVEEKFAKSSTDTTISDLLGSFTAIFDVLKKK